MNARVTVFPVLRTHPGPERATRERTRTCVEPEELACGFPAWATALPK
jgi:hypothetical protein